MLVSRARSATPLSIAGYRWSCLVLCLAIALPVYSFFPVTPKPTPGTDVLNTSRLTEFALLFVSAYILASTAILRRYPLAMRSHALAVSIPFIGWALCSTIWSLNPVYTFGKSFEFLVLIAIAAAVIVGVRGLPRMPRFGVEGLITGAGLLVIVLSFISNAMIWGTAFPFHQNEGRTRFSFGYAHPLETADLCAVTAIIAFAGPLPWPVRLGVAALGSWIAYLADARSTLIFLLAVLCIAAMMHIRPVGLRLCAIALSGIALYVAAILFIQGDFHFLPQDFATLNGRTVLWEESLEVAYDHPLLGVGFYATGDYLVSLFDWAGNAHNAYLEVILATGVIGFLLLLIFLGYAVWLCFRTRNRALICMLVFICLESLFNPLLLSPRTPMLFFILLMMAAAELPPAPARPSAAGRSPAAQRAKLPNLRLISRRQARPDHFFTRAAPP